MFFKIALGWGSGIVPQTNRETARSELEEDAFFLDVQIKAGVVGVMAFAENTPF